MINALKQSKRMCYNKIFKLKMKKKHQERNPHKTKKRSRNAIESIERVVENKMKKI